MAGQGPSIDGPEALQTAAARPCLDVEGIGPAGGAGHVADTQRLTANIPGQGG